MDMVPLNEQQRAAVEHGEGPLLIVAGAGTGKTRVIVERVGYLLSHVPGLRPENILALTFANKAAEQMGRRAVEQFGERAQRVRFSTFHAFCYDLLREELPLRALDKIDQWIFLRRHLEELELDYYLKASEPGRFLHDLVEFCSQCHDNLVSPADYGRYVEELATQCEQRARAGKPQPDGSEEEMARLREVARVYQKSEDLQKQENWLSFGAMISQAVFRLKESPELLHRLQRRYRYILVDEFQDTNAAQWALLKLLAGKRKNITVVGDDYQAIYRFRGAADGSLEQFEKEDFPNCQRIPLNRNYRSTKSILHVANEVAKKLASYLDEKKLNPAPDKTQDGAVEVVEFADAEQQAEGVAAEIARRVESGEAEKYSDFAVLYRKHILRDPLVAALRRRDIPIAIRGLAVHNQPPVRDLVAYLRAIGHPEDNVSLARVLADPQWKLEPRQLVEYCRAASHGKTSLRATVEDENSAGWPGRSRLLELLGRYRRIAGLERLCAWLEALRRELGLVGPPPIYETALRAFLEFVAKWDKEKCSGGMLPEFLEYFAYSEEAGGVVALPEEEGAETAASVASLLHAQEAVVAEQLKLSEESANPAPLGRVQLLTVHAAKGLEFPHVFLFHLVQRAFPMPNRQPLISLPTALWARPLLRGDSHLEEERRLFYVGLTRAKRQLTLCTISNERQRPSRFLEELRGAKCPDLDWKQAGPKATAEPRRQRPAEEANPLPAETVSLSISQLETYLDCPLKYQYRYVWQIPLSPSAALLFGSILHGAVKEVVRAIVEKPGNLHRETLEAILNRHWPKEGLPDKVQERKYREMGLRQLEGVWQVWSAEKFELLHQEKKFEFDWSGTKLVGRMDQINRVAPNEVELIEYKTGRPQTQKDADHSLQLTLYAEACRQALGLLPRSLVLFNLTTGERVRTSRTPEEFRDLEQKIGQTAGDILAGKFPAQPGYHCRYCDFRPICPAHEESAGSTG